jgi:hypothetical protein
VLELYFVTAKAAVTRSGTFRARSFVLSIGRGCSSICRRYLACRWLHACSFVDLEPNRIQILFPLQRYYLGRFLIILPAHNSEFKNKAKPFVNLKLSTIMSERPQNIGVKALEIYFPTQVRIIQFLHKIPLRIAKP